jgi:peptidoglycan hydrolase CwlO-like protein
MTPAEMQIPELYDALAKAEAELSELSGKAKDAYRLYRDLDAEQTVKAHEVRELQQELRAANSTTGEGS